MCSPEAGGLVRPIQPLSSRSMQSEFSARWAALCPYFPRHTRMQPGREDRVQPPASSRRRSAVSGGPASGAGTGAMIFPFSLNQQRNEAERLAAALRRSETPILHVLCFSALTLNHMVLLFGVEEMPRRRCVSSPTIRTRRRRRAGVCRLRGTRHRSRMNS
jgi:hypothetical protein